jgi:hypothetical protein
MMNGTRQLTEGWSDVQREALQGVARPHSSRCPLVCTSQSGQSGDFGVAKGLAAASALLTHTDGSQKCSTPGIPKGGANMTDRSQMD